MKTCTVCRISKPLSCFYRREASTDGKSPHCKVCDNKRRKKWREDNPERNQASQRNRNLLKRYGITLAEYQSLFEAQGCKCGICGVVENYSGHTGPRKEWSFSVDHCHTTGKIRGLLCNDCNRALGLFKDDKELLKSAIVWLDTKDV